MFKSFMVPRLKRGAKPERKFRRYTYRDAKPHLILEFDGRCVYSGQHAQRAGGEKCMEVDHYDSSQKKSRIQDYYNLLLATRHCNGAKSNHPSKHELELGFYIINPCSEMDYGNHIFEDDVTHYLWGATHVGKWHIRQLDLNAEHLVEERATRSKFIKLLHKGGVTFKRDASYETLSTLLAELVNEVKLMIPVWPTKPIPAGYIVI